MCKRSEIAGHINNEKRCFADCASSISSVRRNATLSYSYEFDFPFVTFNIM